MGGNQSNQSNKKPNNEKKKEATPPPVKNNSAPEGRVADNNKESAPCVHPANQFNGLPTRNEMECLRIDSLIKRLLNVTNQRLTITVTFLKSFLFYSDFFRCQKKSYDRFASQPKKSLRAKPCAWNWNRHS